MAEAAHQQSFNENNGDQQPDQGLDQVHNGVPYQVDDQTLDPSESQVNDHTIDQAQYELQNQLEYQQYQLQDQSQEQLQDQIEDQSQEQLQYQPQDQEDYQLHAQDQGDQGEDQVEYQVEGQPQDQIIDHVQDQVQVQGVPYETTESEQEQANVESVDEEAYGGEENRWPGWPGETVFRLLVPAQKVGSIIGHKGDIIKKIVEETRARIKILDGPPGTMERAVMISATEEPDLSLSPAMDGLLRVHMRVVDGLEGDSTHVPPAKVSTRLLVPAPQAGSLIGKQGATVKSIQEASSCIVRVLGTEALPIFALQDDRAVEVVGDPTSVHKALELIASHLRKFLVDRGIIPLFETQMQKPSRQMDHMPPHQPWGPPPQGLPQHAGGGPGYGHNPPPYMQQPPRHVDNYYPPEMHTPVMEKQPHQGISAYGREPAMGIHASSAPTQQVTQQMQIPLSYADAVIGTSGSNISYIRRISGATVTIQESRGAPGEMTVEISGAASQVLTAQQLVQNFMAEAGAPAPAPTQTAVSADQAYNMYAAHHNAVYASSATNPGHAAHPGGYGTDYGTGYGY